MKKIINIAIVCLFFLNVNAQQSRVKAKPIKQTETSANILSKNYFNIKDWNTTLNPLK